tara:strand:+ start:1653 stop:2126 length:474 start_codon:yes stop_codon:yes gene_type:complete
MAEKYQRDKDGNFTDKVKQWWGNSKIKEWTKDIHDNWVPHLESDPVSVTAMATNATHRFAPPKVVSNARAKIDNLMSNLPWDPKISRTGHKVFNQKKMMMDIVGEGQNMIANPHRSPDFALKSNINPSIDPRKTLLNAKSMLGDGYGGSGSYKNKVT